MADITIRVSAKTLTIATLALLGAIAICAFAYLRSTGLLISTYHLSVYAPEVGGVSAGTPVLLDGIQIGAVDAVRLAGESANPQRRILFTLRIRKGFQDDIRRGSTATITPQGLLGRPVVDIQRGFTGASISAGQEIPFVQTPKVAVTDLKKLLAEIADCRKLQGQSPKETPR